MGIDRDSDRFLLSLSTSLVKTWENGRIGERQVAYYLRHSFVLDQYAQFSQVGSCFTDFLKMFILYPPTLA